jgi:hypothetical protein
MLYQTTSIPSGDAGTLRTLQLMAQLATEGAISPVMREVVAGVVLGSGRDPRAHAELIGQWLAERTEFLADPSVAEALVPATDALQHIVQRGIFQGDCDDVAVLAAAMGLCIGLRARFVVVAFHAPDAPYAHVFTELGGASDDSLLPIDPTRPSLDLPPVSRYATFEVTDMYALGNTPSPGSRPLGDASDDDNGFDVNNAIDDATQIAVTALTPQPTRYPTYYPTTSAFASTSGLTSMMPILVLGGLAAVVIARKKH